MTALTPEEEEILRIWLERGYGVGMKDIVRTLKTAADENAKDEAHLAEAVRIMSERGKRIMDSASRLYEQVLTSGIDPLRKVLLDAIHAIRGDAVVILNQAILTPADSLTRVKTMERAAEAGIQLVDMLVYRHAKTSYTEDAIVTVIDEARPFFGKDMK